MTTRERRHCLTLGLFLSMLAVSRGATTNQFPNNQVSGACPRPYFRIYEYIKILIIMF